MGLMQVVALSPDDEALFLSLVSGPTSETLDDGEAATLACAERLGACAVIDERKATSLAGRRLPHLEICTTCDLLLGPNVRGRLGDLGLANALFAALNDARMRVPDCHAATIVCLLGERAAACRSIPGRFRVVATPA